MLQLNSLSIHIHFAPLGKLLNIHEFRRFSIKVTVHRCRLHFFFRSFPSCGLLLGSHVIILYFRSLMLLLQSALPVALFSSSQCDLHLGGGTNAEMAPPVDYFLHVFSPIAKKMGVETECFVDKR